MGWQAMVVQSGTKSKYENIVHWHQRC